MYKRYRLNFDVCHIVHRRLIILLLFVEAWHMIYKELYLVQQGWDFLLVLHSIHYQEWCPFGITLHMLSVIVTSFIDNLQSVKCVRVLMSSLPM